MISLEHTIYGTGLGETKAEGGGVQINFLIGKAQKDNHPLIMAADPMDAWFHFADLPSAHLIAKIGHLSLSDSQEVELLRAGADALKSRMR